MDAPLRSNELHLLLDRVHRKNLTGFVSVSDREGTRRVYGTLQVLRGRLVSAEFANLEGRAALEALRTRDGLSVLFDRSRVTVPDGVDLPSVPEYLGAVAARGAISERFRRVVEETLAETIGPMANLLGPKAFASAVDENDALRRLAERIPDAERSRRFDTEVRRRLG